MFHILWVRYSVRKRKVKKIISIIQIRMQHFGLQIVATIYSMQIMKNHSKYTAILSFMAIAAATLTSCNKRDTHSMEFESYEYRTLTEVTEKDSLFDDSQRYWLCSGSGVLPVKSGDVDIQFLRDSLERLAMVHFPEKKAEPRLRPFLKAVDIQPDSVTAGSQSNDQLSIVLATPKVIVWQDFYQEYIAGGAHGTYSYAYVNYSIPHNKILLLSDLLKPGYEKALTQLLREQLASNTNLLVESEEIEIPSQFLITSQGLEFVWGVYEIAPFSEGAIRVELTGWDLAELLTPLGREVLEID